MIPAKRKSIIISTSLTGSGSVFIEIDDPAKLSAVRQAVSDLIERDYNVPPANMGFTIEQAYSEEQLEMSLHASYKIFGADVKNAFDYSNTHIKTRMVL